MDIDTLLSKKMMIIVLGIVLTIVISVVVFRSFEKPAGYVWYADPKDLQVMRAALDKYKVSYVIKVIDGKEHIGWTKRNESAFRKVEVSVSGERPPLGSKHVCTKNLERFKDWLKERNIAFKTSRWREAECVIWAEADDAVVRTFSGGYQY